MINRICPEESEDSSETGTVYPVQKNHENNRKLTLSKCAVFFDFDNTITPLDVIDDIVERFSINEKWRKIEEDWKRGKIGSKECLKGQFAQVRIKKDAFIRYLSTIKIDKYFPKILALLKRRKASVYIVSDSSSFIINNILKNNNIRGIKIYSNRLKLNNDKLVLEFPHFNKRCPKCANCKKSHLRKADIKDKITIYIGDGLSDICAAGYADIVFAKASLLKHFKKQNKKCIEFDTLAVVYNYLKEIA
ncbi:MAG: MtnX-like HAD-IB family phosphatase [Candidatus Omnitrophica bacterium]|jgi:2,3-diketo-5-methylthio-1-phosphopentane phosphatase|nr:MtnX-like HAD-IB family phosphatase [Candidatus Omnitrophota bacterium]